MKRPPGNSGYSEHEFSHTQLGLKFSQLKPGITRPEGALIFRTQKERGWPPDLFGGKRGASVGSFIEESFAPGTSTQTSARQGVLPVPGLVGTSEASYWFSLLTCAGVMSDLIVSIHNFM